MARGELRIYMGAAPGVGKTFAMLNEGWRRRERGAQVVVAYLEAHDRPETTAQLRDMEVVPRRMVSYRGQTFEEMDVDAVLARRPEIALVDELAHTNVPGSRNEKRWQDIEELLEAGISVISTVNVQHLESLNDVIAQITGIVQRETVPDVFVRAAEQIELVDMTPEALRRRMAHGNIYAADKVDAALANYFRSGNLGAMRELSLLWVADRVEEEIEMYRQRHGITARWETRERVVVALTGAPGGEQLIRRGTRLAGRAGGELVGVHIRAVDGLSSPDQTLLDDYRELLDELGGRYAEVTGADTAQALVEFARAENATQIILGASRRSRWAEITSGSVVTRVTNLANGIDVHVISSQPEPHDRRVPPKPPRRRPSPRPVRLRVLAWIVALIGTPLLSLALAPSENGVGIAATLLILFVGPIAAALLGGLGPALGASVTAFLALDVLFVSPTLSLRFAKPSDLVTLIVFVAVSALVSVLVHRLAGRTAEVVRERAEADALAQLVHSTAILDADALDRLVGELRATLGLDAVAVLAPVADGWRVEASAGEPLPTAPADGSYAAELANGATLVVVGPPLASQDRRLLSAFVAQVRLAQATLALQAEATRTEALAEANDLRDAILAAVSHDLRGPLANIKAAATSLTSTEMHWDEEDVDSFARTIDAEADRLTTLIVNLLDMSRLQTGMVGVHRSTITAAEVIYAAVASLSGDTSTIDIDVPEDLPMVLTHPALLERVLANIIRNALDWAPDGTRVRVEAAEIDARINIRVIDHGAGIPRDERADVFRPFQRLGDGGRAAIQGIGLGLAVAHGFCEAISAAIAIDDTPGGGTTITITVPTEKSRT